MRIPPVILLALAPGLLTPNLSAETPTSSPNVVPPGVLSVSDPDLEVTLWAQSPQLKNPTNLDFDGEGRVWVAEGVNYRGHHQRQPEGDRIVVLEDTDGDGRADSQSVFVQEKGLLAPMGLAVIDNRVIVSMAPDIIVYTDVNRDRKFDPAVDRREVLLTGFNGRRHDHSIHSVTQGPNGQWYWNAGNCGSMFTDKSGRTFRIGSAYDGGRDLGWEPMKIAGMKSDDGHVWIGGFAARMNPDGSQVRIIGHNFRNSYEQTVTSFGDVFQNDNDDPPACRTTFLLESGNAGFCSADGKRSWGADRRPGQSVPVAEWRQEDPGTMPPGDVYGGGSPTGIAFVEDSALGPKYRGLLLSCEPGRNVVFGYLPKSEGAGFALKRFDFLTSNREGEFSGTDFQGGSNPQRQLKTLFRPSDVGVGADGAIYVADWFDPRVGGHADWDDTTSGAIYRIAPKGHRSRPAKVDLSTPKGAAEALKNPVLHVRAAAYNALRAQGPSAIKPVERLLKDPNPHVRARAAWVLSLDPRQGLPKVAGLLKDSDPQIRVVAFRALRQAAEKNVVADNSGSSRKPAPGSRAFFLETAQRLASDSSPAVRREVAVSLRDEPYTIAGPILLTLADGFDGADRTYLEAWGTGATGKEAQVYDALLAKSQGRGPVQWTPALASLAWRLHPESSIRDFKARGLAESLSDTDRKRALTALGFNASPAAADAVLEVAAKSSGTVKAEAMWWLLNRKDSQWKDAGLATALKSRGIYDPDAVSWVEATVPAAEAPKFTASDVLSLRGDSKRGGERFKAVCISCHRVEDVGTEYAPNLTGWARRQTPEVLVKAVIQPSAEIASGFNGSELTTHDGTVIQGLLLSEGDPMIVQSAGGLTQMIPRSKVKSRQGLNRSLMLSADQLGLSAQDLADIAAYLREH
ncbi:MAG: PVC-type heme-binding CxxCH protein [Limisphaerales bacterium]